MISIEDCNDSNEINNVDLVCRSSMAATLGYDDAAFIETIQLSACASRRTRFLASQQNIDWDFRVVVPPSFANTNSETSESISTALELIETSSADEFANEFVTRASSNGNLAAQTTSAIESSLDTEGITTVSNGMASGDGDKKDNNMILIIAAVGGGVVIVLFVVALFMCRRTRIDARKSNAKRRSADSSTNTFKKNEMIETYSSGFEDAHHEL